MRAITLVLLVASSCPSAPPGNKPPAAPKLEATLLGTNAVVGTASPCLDDGKPVGSVCTQEAVALLPGTALVVSRVPVQGGEFALTNLNDGALYDVLVGSSDTVYQTWSARRPFRTSSFDSESIAQGVAPTELTLGSVAYVEGYSLKAEGSPVLIDARTGALRPLTVLTLADNRASLQIPSSLAGLAGRQRYFLRWGAGHKARTVADVVYVSPSIASIPPSEVVRVQFVRFEWTLACPYTNQFPVLGPPYECGCVPKNRFAVGTRLTYGNPWNDTWTATFWSKLKLVADDTSREWSAMCSEARGSEGFNLSGLAEARARITQPSTQFYWLDMLDEEVLTHLARREDPTKLSVPKDCEGTRADGLQFEYPWCDILCGPCEWYTPDYCDENSVFQVPDSCRQWHPNNPDEMNVFAVGALYLGDVEVDPATGPRGFTPLQHPGMVIVTDNPWLHARRKWPVPMDWTYWDASGVCLYEHPEWTYYDDTPYNLVYSWGPGRDVEFPPGVLAHELAHALLGRVDPTVGTACDTIMVSKPTASCPRGFDLQVNDFTTVAEECATAVQGIGPNDYTH